jgi:hypothetical protein
MSCGTRHHHHRPHDDGRTDLEVVDSKSKGCRRPSGDTCRIARGTRLLRVNPPRLCTLNILLSAAAFITAAVPSSAQTGASIGLGAGVAVYQPVDDLAHRSIGPAITYRFGNPEGWRPAFGLNWYGLRFDAPIGGERTALGRLRVRPLMGGYGYSLRRDRFAVTSTLVGGVSFNSFDADDRARLAYARHFDITLLRISASNGPAARAEVGVWFDLDERFGLLVSAGYMLARPTITIVTGDGEERRRLNADAVKLQVGLVYAIF